MRGFRAQTRSDIDGAMTSAAQALSEPDIEAVAHYLAHAQGIWQSCPSSSILQAA